MKKQYYFLKTIRYVIVLFMLMILGYLLNFIYNESNKAANNNSSMPIAMVWLYLLLYIPVVVAGFWSLRWIKNNLRKNFPEKYLPRGPLTKKIIYKIILKTILIVAFLTVLILFLVPFGTIYFATHHHVYYKNNSLLQMTYTAADYGMDENILNLVTEDNLDIWASELTVENPKAVIIYLTGIEQPSITQFYAHAKWMQENGYASILLEVRGHGKSDGNKVCLGYDEILDVKAAIDYIKNKAVYDDVPLVVHGVSMGGSIATNAFGQYEEIDALIAMSTYTTFEDVVIDNLKYFGVPSGICAIEKPIFRLALKANFGSEKVNIMNPITQIQNANGRPILLVASEGDMSVPATNTKRLLEVSKDADIWLKDSWEHFIVKGCILSEVKEDKEYCEKILEFLEKVEEDYNSKN